MNSIDQKWELVCSKVSKLSLKSENEGTALCPSHQDSNPPFVEKKKGGYSLSVSRVLFSGDR